jgi:hypothetical protein
MKLSRHLVFWALVVLLSFGSAAGNPRNYVAPLVVKISYLPKCGAIEPTVNLVKQTAKELNLKIDLQSVPISTTEQARANRHIGSPTIQINGLDIEPAARSYEYYGIS